MPHNLGFSYQDKRVLVLGASGFIGRWVARLLGTHGARLHLVVRQKALAERILARYRVRGVILQQDLERLDQVENLLRTIRPTVTFNLAGYGVDPSERDERRTARINTDLVQAVAAAAAKVRDPSWEGSDVVHVGSALEYGSVEGVLTEESVPHPTTVYGRSKLAGTEALRRSCQDYDIRGVTARLFTVYGPGEHEGRLLPSLLTTARGREPLPLTAGSQRRDFTFVEDVAEGLLRLGAGRGEPGEIVNLATGVLTSVRSFVEIAAAVLSIPTERLSFGMLPTRPEEMTHRAMTIARLEQRTGWRPSIDIAEGVRRTRDFGFDPHASMV